MFKTNDLNATVLSNFKDIPDKARSKLTEVYALLSLATFSMVGGVFYFPAWLATWRITLMIVIIGLIVYMNIIDAQKKEQKVLLLSIIGYLFGGNMQPMINMYLAVKPDILMQAIGYTACMFASFTAMSLLSKRRSFLFLGGIISSIMSCLFWMAIIRFFFGYQIVGGYVYSIIGVIFASLYVIFDTQLIVERLCRGDHDTPKHALVLFVDLIQLFIKVLAFLNENDNKKKRRN